METKIIKTNEINERQLIETYSIFEYKCVERTVKGKNITLKFERDDSVPYINELKKCLRSIYRILSKDKLITYLNPEEGNYEINNSDSVL